MGKMTIEYSTDMDANMLPIEVSLIERWIKNYSAVALEPKEFCHMNDDDVALARGDSYSFSDTLDAAERRSRKPVYVIYKFQAEITDEATWRKAASDKQNIYWIWSDFRGPQAIVDLRAAGYTVTDQDEKKLVKYWAHSAALDAEYSKYAD